MKKIIVGVAAIAISFALGAGFAAAQDPQALPQVDQQYGPSGQGGDSSQTADSAAPGVARLSFIRGDVSTQRGDNGDWVAATLNTPVSVSDRVATGNGGRAEVQLDAANVLRMSASATAKIADLNRTTIQIQVGQGLVTYSVLRGSDASSEIETPNASIRPNGPGEFRILVNSDAETEVIARQGSAEVSTPQGSTHIDSGEMITVAGTDNPQYKTDSAPRRDDWDSWNDDRDKRIETASSWRNTDRYYTGSEDLDANGTWTEVPDYGRVWVPSQGPDWAPYRDGRWVYEPYYGWTWVSYEPWGWAPYHYGRWFVYGGGWAWWPGPVYEDPGYYPIWAPAYVSFFGYGGGGWGVNVGFGFGGYGRYGWLPCGPGDWYQPWYGRWGGRVNVVNVTNIHNTTINNFHDGFAPLGGNRGRHFSNIDEAMRNDRVRGGISSMAGNEFGRQAVSRHQGRMSEVSFRQASLVSGKMPVSPSRESYSPSGRNVNPSTFRNAPPASQHFFAGNTRTNVSGQRTFGNANNETRGQSSIGGNRNSGSFGRAPSQGEPPAANSNRTNGAVVQSNREAWRTFTPPQSANSGNPRQDFAQNARGAADNPRGNSGGNSTNSNHETLATPSRQPAQQDRGNWQHFAPPSHQMQQSERGGSSPSPQSQRGGTSQPQTFERRNGSQPDSRQPLNMRQPVVAPRSNSAPRGADNGPRPTYNSPRPSYSEPRPTYTAPRPSNNPPQPTYNAPRSGGGQSAPRGNYGGGGSSSPRGNSGGGGDNHGGGGGNRSNGRSR